METKIFWGDVETNGVNDDKDDVLLEVAFLVTDLDLNILDETGYQAVVHYPVEEVEAIKAKTNDYVVDMHTKTGLWDRLPQGKPLEQIDDELLAYLKSFESEEKSARLAGNSITLDRNFMRKFLPKSFNHIHYRSIDVSTLAGLAQYWAKPKVQYRKNTVHSAFADITESIEELRFLRENIMSV